jgi:hypothetical protein
MAMTVDLLREFGKGSPMVVQGILNFCPRAAGLPAVLDLPIDDSL